MTGFSIRRAEYADIDEIMRVYAAARQYMRESGNPNQWKASYPSEELIKSDISRGELYAGCGADGIYGVFFFSLRRDATYTYIEGSWLNDSDYGVIHRIASDGRIKGFFGLCLSYCSQFTDNIRIDTHDMNTTMRHVLEKHGFSYRGTIYLADGQSRRAYQLCL